MSGIHLALARTYREEQGRILASLIGWMGDFELAEEVLQDAFAAALTRWAADGVPDRPGAWLLTTARNRALDRVRRDASFAGKVPAIRELAHLRQDELAEAMDVVHIPDERLRLLFTCCHPALPMEAQVSLTLRTLCGLSTREIARAFLTKEATMAQRLVRAKKKIAAAGIPYRVPPAELLPERLPGVLRVIYLVFNEGYHASHGQALIRHELCKEGIRLGRLLDRLMPDEPEAMGLLALMVLHHARHAARTDRDGQLITLEEQDRGEWDGDAIRDGLTLLSRAFSRQRVGPYQLQAAIAGLHCGAPAVELTDWAQIATLYSLLERFEPNPIVTLNRAVAVAMSQGPDAGLALMEQLSLPGYSLLPAAMADLHRRAGRPERARGLYEEAIALAENEAERALYRRRRDRLGY